MNRECGNAMRKDMANFTRLAWELDESKAKADRLALDRDDAKAKETVLGRKWL